MSFEKRISFFPDVLFQSDQTGIDFAPTLIAESGIPFYDANHFLEMITVLKESIVRYGLLTAFPVIEFLGSGLTGDVYRLKFGDIDVAIKLMYNSKLGEFAVKNFLELASVQTDYDLRLQRLTYSALLLSPQRALLCNLGGSIVGHRVFPDLIDKPSFILTNQGQIIGFANPTIEGEAFSLYGVKVLGEYLLSDIETELQRKDISLDTARNAHNAIRKPDGKYKLIDLSLYSGRLRRWFV